eukprot:8061762-Karenia_brevis.AAC.1
MCGVGASSNGDGGACSSGGCKWLWLLVAGGGWWLVAGSCWLGNCGGHANGVDDDDDDDDEG